MGWTMVHLSLEEAAKRVGSGEFKPDDLSWHQGVSGWVPLKQTTRVVTNK